MSATEIRIAFYVYKAERASNQMQKLEWHACTHIKGE